jgi:uncharacterized membrane protein
MSHTDERDALVEVETQPVEARTSAFAILGAAAAGAALAYFFDPVRGARRRSMVRDQIVHVRARADDVVGTTVRDLGNRARGLVAEARERVKRGDADDPVIEARVRTALGRVVSHPSAIDVRCEFGRVTLSGPVLAAEVDELLSTVRGVRGVEEVENQLEVHDTRNGVPALQGGVRRIPRNEFAQENWAPATRLVASAAGTALLVWGARQRGAAGAALRLAGTVLSVRALTNMPARRLTGIAAGRRAVDVQKAITVQAPVEQVYSFFILWDNWPRWMSHVREVRVSGNVGDQVQTHWVVDGPAGTTVKWDAVTTALEPNKRIAWKTVEGSAIEHAGVIRFTPTADGATTIDIKMSYNPPAGAVGHAVASILGRDPKHQMDDDLARLKTTIETGIPPRDASVRRENTAGEELRA